MQPRRAYRSDLSDERWALIESVLEAWRAGLGGLGPEQPTHDLREVANAIEDAGQMRQEDPRG